jgi:hypothetical protein
MPLADFMHDAGFVLVFLVGSALCIFFLKLWEVMPPRPIAPSHRCSRCRRGSLERISADRDDDRFYRCDACGSRYIRFVRNGRLHEAPTRQSDRAFVRERAQRDSAKPPPPVDHRVFWKRAIAAFLRSKRICGIGGIKKKRVDAAVSSGHMPALWDSELDGAS